MAEMPEPSAHDPHAAVDARDELWRSLGRLPKRQRLVLVLRYFEDLTEAEAADVMGCSIGTVKSQTAKALTKLRLDESLGATI
jgi:RNA polymerase sigma factor (sigma-70 family)